MSRRFQISSHRVRASIACFVLMILGSAHAMAQSADSTAPTPPADGNVLFIDGFTVTLHASQSPPGADWIAGDVAVPLLGDAPIAVRVEGLTRDALGRAVARRVASAGDLAPTRLSIGGEETPTIYATALEITPNGSSIAAHCLLALPGLGPDAALDFSSERLPIDARGIVGEAAFGLERDARLPDAGGIEYRFVAGGDSDAGSMLTIDSAGLLAARLDIRVAFPRAWMLPVERYTTGSSDWSPDVAIGDARVGARLRFEHHRRAAGDNASVSGVRNWIARGSMPPFALGAQPDVSISGGELVLDQSLLEGARSSVTDATTDRQWVGMKLTGATLQLPPAFRDGTTGLPVRIAAQDIVIDDGGLTLAQTLPAPAAVRFGDWRATLDSMRLILDHGAIASAAVGGSIALPDLDRALRFTGTIASRLPVAGDSAGSTPCRGYVLALGAADGVRLDRWRSTIAIAGGSVELAATDGAARASLSGSLTVDSTIGSTHRIDLRDIHFEGLGVRTGTRAITLPLWSLASPQHGLGAYPFSLTQIGYATRDDGRPALRFSFGLNLGEQSAAIPALGEIDVFEVLHDVLDPYLSINSEDTVFDDGHSITGLHLNLVPLTDALMLSGDLYYFEGDTTYGDGWYGKLDVKILRAATKIVGQFGTMNAGTPEKYRYWYFDTRIKWPTGLALGTTGAGWYGIIGGLSHHMRRDSIGDPPGLPEPDINTTPRGIGQSVSGYRFVPDDGILGGLKIGGIFGSYPDPKMVMTDIAIEGSLTTGNSLSEVGVSGVVRLMEKKMLGRRTGSYEWNIFFTAFLQFNPDFELACAVRADYDKFPLAIKDCQARLKLGEGDWYFMIGEPRQRVRVVFAAVIPAADGYLMMGSRLPSDELEPGLASAFPAYRQLFAAGGAGMALGARLFGWNWSGSWKGLGYHLRLQVGFGLSVRDYDGACDASGRPADLGINGWYALGRIYGLLSIGVDLWGWHPSVDASAIALGGGPNPFWLKGRVKVRWLGSFSFGWGSAPTTCDRTLALPADFIRSVEPGGGAAVSPFTWEVATFQAGIGEEFDVEIQTFDPNDPNKAPERFHLRPVLKEFSLRRTSDQALVPADLSTALEDRTATLAPLDALDGTTAYRARVVVAADCFDAATRSWKRWKDGANEVTRDTSVVFTTAERPRDIPEWNIAFTTPLSRHRDFYPRDGIGPARVHLKTGASYLLGEPARLAARFVATNGGVDGAAVEADASSHGKAIDFTLPELATGTFYRGEIVRKGTPGSGGGAIPDSTVIVWHFRTSAYRSLAEKVADMRMTAVVQVRDSGWIDMLACSDLSDEYWGRRMEQPLFPELSFGVDGAGEGFDEYELRGLSYDVGHGISSVPPMLHVRSLSSSPWHAGFYQDTILRLADLSLAAALRSRECGADMNEAAAAYAHLRTLMSDVDSVAAMPLLSDAEIASGELASVAIGPDALRIDYRDELVAWRFWTHAALVDSCQRLSCGTSDAALREALAIRWRPLDAGRYDLSAWYDGRWWRTRLVGGDFGGPDPQIVPGILSFDYAP